MTISDEAQRRAAAIMRAESEDFAGITHAAGLDPATSWRGANLGGVDFGNDDLTGFRFVRALLHGADLSRARGLHRDMFHDAAWDETTRFPPGFGLPASRLRPPLEPLARWRDPIPGLSEGAWPEMVTLPAGEFVMGAPEDEEGSLNHERPRRVVTVGSPFALGRCAVTFAQWDAAVAAGFKPPRDAKRPDDRGWGRGEHPVIHVSWNDARAYCGWLNERLGLREGTYRLPSEAEWEYGCRAWTETAFSFGETITPSQVNYNGNYVYGHGPKGEYRGRTVPVGSLPANGWGLHEMHGNVWEWCEDAYGRYPSHATDAQPLKNKKDLRVLRGGSWDLTPGGCRSAARFKLGPVRWGNDVGFRLARTLF